jgi:ribosome-associated protein
MIRVSRTFAIPEHEIDEEFVQSSGPGGQNVNKVASAVQLRFKIDESSTLPSKVKERLKELAQNRITTNGVLIIESQNHRTQHKNRKAAREKLAQLIRKALKPPKKRKKTKPSRSSKKRRLEKKRLQARKKKLRKDPPIPPE